MRKLITVNIWVFLGMFMFSVVAANAGNDSASSPRKTVTIYEFKSQVAEISPQSATDMFMTALVKIGRAHV